jgi:hypothetical protein
MKERIMAFLQNEKLKVSAKKVFNKKNITGVVIILVLAVALRIGFSLIFEVEGTVNKVDGSKITVANFLNAKTVDIGNFQTTPSNIQVGDRIEIMKNLSGDVISVRDNNSRHMNEKGNFNGKEECNFKGNGERNSKRGK